MFAPATPKLRSCYIAIALGAFLFPAKADFTLVMRDITGGSDGTPGSLADCEEIWALSAPDAKWIYNEYTESPNPATINVAGGGSYGGSAPLPSGTQQADNYALKATANLVIPAGDWTIGFGSDDGGRLRIPGITFLTKNNDNSGGASPDDEVHYTSGRGHAWTFGTFTLTAPLTTTIDAVMWEGSGGDSWEIAFAAGHQTGFSTSTWKLLEDGVDGWTVQVAPINDTDPPSIIELSPADDSTGAFPGGSLIATFDEEIAPVTGGTIILTDLTNGTDNRTFTIGDPEVTVSGTQLTIAPATNLAFNTEYQVTIGGADNTGGAGPDTIEDTWTTPNVYGGTVDGEWTFTTAAEDLTAPVITDTDPANGATNVVPDANLIATFDENIVVGSGTITIVDTTDNSSTQTITVPGPEVSSVGNVLTIDPPANLEGATVYAVQLSAGVVENYSGVGNVAITDTTTWNFGSADTTVYTGPNSNGQSDTWNVPANWDVAVPAGSLNAVLPATTITVDATPPAYTGNLTLQDNAHLRIEWTGSDPSFYTALGTPGDTVITAGNGAMLTCRAGGTHVFPELVLGGDFTIVQSQSTQPSVNFDFDYPISGSGTLILQGKGGSNANLNVANTMGGVLINEQSNGADGHTINANATGSLGSGDVTLAATTSGGKSANLNINAADAIADTATLTLDGSTGSTLITMNADDTVGTLVVGGFTLPAGTYGRIGTPATVDNEVAFVSGDSVLTVASGPTDTTAPTVVAISDDSVGGEVFLSLQPTITFFLTFDEPVSSSVTPADFAVTGSATASVTGVSQTALDVIEVTVSATGTGSLTLSATGTASFADFSGNTLNGPFSDDGSISVRDINDLSTQLGVLDLTTNNGVNPATGNLWQAGDPYRLMFTSLAKTTATSNDIATYNSFIQGVANGSSLGLSGVTWKALASAAGDGDTIPAVDARDNTSTNPSVEPGGGAIFLMNGTEVFATSNTDLWDGSSITQPDRDQEGALVPTSGTGSTTVWTNWYGVWTGTNGSGAAREPLGNGGSVRLGLAREGTGTSNWIDRSNNSDTSIELGMYAISETLTVTSTAAATPYDTWAATFDPADLSDPQADLDNDGLTNLQEFAFGTNPTTATGAITLDGSGNVVNGKGTPVAYLNEITEDGVDFRAIFSRRKDPVADGLVYTVQFSTELDEWIDYEFAPGEPILLDGTDPDIDVVYVPFPLAVETSNGFEKPHFVRVGVEFAP